jgi:hypothetical protein
VFSPQEHLDDLVRHINMVRDNCLLLGERLMNEGRVKFGLALIARGFSHDVSKFAGIEWDYLHAGKDTPKEQLALAVKQHNHTNDHHPEFWGGIEEMPPLAVAEMVCDWLARSQERGTNVRDWIKSEGIERFKIDVNGEQYKLIQEYLNILLQDSFVR